MRSKIGVTDWDFEIEGTVPGPKTETLPIHALYSCPGVVSRQQSQYIKKYPIEASDVTDRKAKAGYTPHAMVTYDFPHVPRRGTTSPTSSGRGKQHLHSMLNPTFVTYHLIFFQDEFLSCSRGQSTPPDGKAIHNKDHGACDNRSHNKP